MASLITDGEGAISIFGAECKLFCACNFVGKHSIHTHEEEEQFTDLLLLMKMMTNILSKDFLEFVSSDNDGNNKLSSADLTLYGLNIVIPLMSTEILKVLPNFFLITAQPVLSSTALIGQP